MSWRSGFLVGALSLGCAHVELPPERLTPELRDEAASWQALDDTSGPVSDEALERRVELALEIGELQAAWEAATTRVARARVEVARATARDDARAVRKARRPWARASHRAFEVAQRSKRAPWIIQAALDAPKPDRYRKAVLDALEHDAWVLAPNDRRRLQSRSTSASFRTALVSACLRVDSVRLRSSGVAHFPLKWLGTRWLSFTLHRDPDPLRSPALPCAPLRSRRHLMPPSHTPPSRLFPTSFRLNARLNACSPNCSVFCRTPRYPSTTRVETNSRSMFCAPRPPTRSPSTEKPAP